jgi:hypothetical protein
MGGGGRPGIDQFFETALGEIKSADLKRPNKASTGAVLRAGDDGQFDSEFWHSGTFPW